LLKDNSFYRPEELKTLGLKRYGKNVLISRKASLYSPSNISLSNNVRIDDFCILSPYNGYINIGSYVHISAYAALYGRMGIIMKDFSGISPRAVIFSASDDFSGNYLTPFPVLPYKYMKIYGGTVIINKYVIIGAGSIMLPNVTIGK